jgi:hypothetical protein
MVHEEIPAMAETCPHCGTEFLLGSRFCHCCGGRRPNAITAAAKADAAAFARLWEKAVARTHSAITGIPWKRIWDTIAPAAWIPHLHVPEILRSIGLPTASLIAFLIGIGCVAGALFVGLFTAQTLVDWQAIQFYRVEWLLAAIASFVAAILLKKPSGN